MREIVLDTETTGLDPDQGDRIVEIGCVELVNHVRTKPPGGIFHCYINPERPMAAAAAAVHGLTDEFLADKPVFADIVEEFLTFVGESPLVIHNAPFDLKFLNAEFRRLGRPLFGPDRAIDTLVIARQRYPGAQASLDALCRRFGVDGSSRVLHGALLDTELLAEVYLELRGGRQPGLVLIEDRPAGDAGLGRPRIARPARPHAPTPDELAAHEALLDQIKEPLWRR
ncbi:MAG: DNA polymerase III subunit epsilon [Alphaproteobacteria bacterium]|jgi:DNA polymerase-3 subunit epsilon|nr:DNA polymerase III subunit epsilon [Alphaproteobacteria bacterium]